MLLEAAKIKKRPDQKLYQAQMTIIPSQSLLESFFSRRTKVV